MESKKSRINRRINVPYGFYVKNNKIAFFNRDYLPLGTSRDGDLDGKWLSDYNYEELFNFIILPNKLMTKYKATGNKGFSRPGLEVFYFYDDSHI